MEELFTIIVEYLQTLGYTAIIEDGVIKATHPRNAWFWVVPVNNGALFRALFNKGPNTATDELGYLRFIARANQSSIVSRFNDMQNVLSVEAWFPNCPNREAIET